MKRLLIVEDHDGLREGYIDVLSTISKEELIIDEAVSAQEAIDLISKADYDYIILDGQLVGSHGRDVLAVLDEKYKNKVLVYSGDVKFLIEAGKNGYFIGEKLYSFEDQWKNFIYWSYNSK